MFHNNYTYFNFVCQHYCNYKTKFCIQLIILHILCDKHLHQSAKCYANITATICSLKLQKVCILPEIDIWSVYQSLPNAYILHRIKNGKVEYSPLFRIKLRVNNISIIPLMRLMKLMIPLSVVQ